MGFSAANAGESGVSKSFHGGAGTRVGVGAVVPVTDSVSWWHSWGIRMFGAGEALKLMD